MGLRSGILVGFLVGSGIASLLSKTAADEGSLGALKRQLREAVSAGEAEKLAKEEEMQRLYRESREGKHPFR